MSGPSIPTILEETCFTGAQEAIEFPTTSVDRWRTALQVGGHPSPDDSILADSLGNCDDGQIAKAQQQLSQCKLRAKFRRCGSSSEVEVLQRCTRQDLGEWWDHRESQGLRLGVELKDDGGVDEDSFGCDRSRLPRPVAVCDGVDLFFTSSDRRLAVFGSAHHPGPPVPPFDPRPRSFFFLF